MPYNNSNIMTAFV